MTDVTTLKKMGGADVSVLAIGTKLYVETTEAVYQLTVMGDGLVMVESSEKPFKVQCPELCTLVRSDWDDTGKVNIPYWVGKAMRMIFKLADGKHYSTHSVVSTRIEASDGSWGYELWEI
ncbi:MAG: hypothetical protein ACYSW8_31705 [Planctomycetota bacterium]|jgi:hypothetical protein